MAGTITVAEHELGTIKKLVITCTADAADGSFPDTVLPAIEGRLLHLETNPGATAPTTLYDITLVNQNGIDVLQGVGANRHTTNSERANIVYAGTIDHPYVTHSDVLTLNIDNNLVNSAIIVMELVYQPGG